MPRESHSFPSEGKQAWRAANLRFFRRHGRLIWNGPLLVGHWVELVGRTGSSSKDLLAEAGALAHPAQFVGVDIDEDVVDEHRASGVDFRTVKNWAVPTAIKMHWVGERVSVLNYDGYAGAASTKWWRKYGYLLRGLADMVVEEHGEFGLILNHAVRGSGMDKNDTVREHVRLAREHMGLAGLEDGHVDVYVSEVNPMITIRVLFRRDEVVYGP